MDKTWLECSLCLDTEAINWWSTSKTSMLCVEIRLFADISNLGLFFWSNLLSVYRGCLPAVCCVYHYWLIMRYSSRIVSTTFIRLKGCFTSVVSVMLLLLRTEKRVCPISCFDKQGNQQALCIHYPVAFQVCSMVVRQLANALSLVLLVIPHLLIISPLNVFTWNYFQQMHAFDAL